MKNSIDKQGNDMKKIWKRILEISYRNKLSHIGSCLTMSMLLYKVYSEKKPEDKVILSAGHSGLALYVILEHFFKIPNFAEQMFGKHGVHPNRNVTNGIYASSGSLGHGIGIGLGMALSDKSRDMYILSTDGEIAEGSWWESLRIADEQKVRNFYVYINVNGYTAYGESSIESINKSLHGWCDNIRDQIKIIKTECNIPSLKALQGHYHVLSKEEYKEALLFI